MTKRFEIEDLVSQDATGVVFRAIDTETKLPVAVRRFFPAGTHVSGMSVEDQHEYRSTVERLTKVSHPALRTIVGGGCDAVDGMPYIATEWIEGTALETLLESRPLSEAEAIMLVTQALDVCVILSEVIGSDGVWVEADVHTIIIGAEETRRPVTFWIYPFKLRGGGSQGLKPLIGLTSATMGWTDKPTSSLATTGLEGWLKWLNGVATTATLHEAREMLASTTGVEPSQPLKRSVAAGQKRKKAKFPVWIIACLILLAVAAGAWLLIRRNDGLLVKARASPAPVSTSAGVGTAAVAGGQTITSPVRVFSSTDYDLLAAQDKNEVIVEGVFQTITSVGKTMYIVFAGSSGKSDFRGAISQERAVGDMSEAALRTILGRKIRLNGKIKIESPGRLVMDIKKSSEIQPVD